MLPLPIPQERRALGQARRKQVRRQQHRHWDPSARRQSPLIIIERSMRGRVRSLIPIKYERMVASPFGFFRGSAPVMASDLSLLPNTGIPTQICGDAHILNLGAFAAPDGRLLFDINDFDETVRGPFEWDLKRLATSLVLAGRQVGSKRSLCEEAVHAFAGRYRKSVHLFAGMPIVEFARFQVHRLQRIAPVSQVLLKAERATPQHLLDSLTEPAPEKPGTEKSGTEKSGAEKQGSAEHRIFRNEPPLLVRLTAAQARPVLASLDLYRDTLLPERQHFLSQYRPVDVAFKVVGTGAVGLRDYVIHFEGNGPGDPLFLQIKEEPGSAFAPYMESTGCASHQGRRVAEGQRAMQFQSDPFLGWTTIAGRDYLVRQLNDHKGSIDPEQLKGDALLEYALVCGELLARGHARSGDPQVLAGYLGNNRRIDEALSSFAEAYADQTEKDWEALKKQRAGKSAS